MPDEDAKAAADKANAEEIKRNEATSDRASGNVHSEPDEGEPGFDAPPPLPN